LLCHLLLLHALHRLGLLLLLLDLLLVGLQVTEQVELREETPLAVLTSEPLVAFVDLHMLVQVSLLSEGMLAVRVSALVGPLLGVDAQVVEEVVPLAEDL
jgi:hypothetical protein